MKTNAPEKLYHLELTEDELIAISEGVSVAATEAQLSGNDVRLFVDMASEFVVQHPIHAQRILHITRNYTLMNHSMSKYESSISWVVSKAEKILETI